MRTLSFCVDRQQITKDENCDFSGLVPGTEGYLNAYFSFTGEWDGCKKAAVFSCNGKECAVPIINGSCVIPAQALKKSFFKVYVVGERDGYRIITNKVEVLQNG